MRTIQLLFLTQVFAKNLFIPQLDLLPLTKCTNELYDNWNHHKPKCNPDGSYFETQVDPDGTIFCVTKWAGKYKWALKDRPCDFEIFRPQHAKGKCFAQKLLNENTLEEAAKKGLVIEDLVSKTCQGNGKFQKFQHGMMGEYCVDEENGEFIGMVSGWVNPIDGSDTRACVGEFEFLV